MYDAKNSYAYNDRGSCKKKKGDNEGAIKDYEKAIQIDPKMAFAYNNLGSVKRMNKDYTGAIEDFNESLKIKPDYKLALLERGVTYYQTEKDALALADLSKVIELDSKSGRAYYFRGKLKKYMSDVPGSCADLKQAQSLKYAKAEEELIKNGCK